MHGIDGTELPNFRQLSLPALPHLAPVQRPLRRHHLVITPIADLNDDGYPGNHRGHGRRQSRRALGWRRGRLELSLRITSGWMRTDRAVAPSNVIDRFGNHLPGFPKYVLETVQSSRLSLTSMETVYRKLSSELARSATTIVPIILPTASVSTLGT